MAITVARIASRAQLGLHAPLVHVEVHLGSGLPQFSIVGLAATAVKESKERVRAALANSGFEFPAGRITVNLAPADLPKEGGRFDLPIAIGILLASQQIKLRDEHAAHLGKCEFYGELALTGELKPIKGILLAAAHAAKAGHELIVPRANVDEARMAARMAVRAMGHLLEVCEYVRDNAVLVTESSSGLESSRRLKASDGSHETREPSAPTLDLSDLHGQSQAKRALAIAAAGAHSLLLVGPPGCGKSMLAQRLPGLLPPLTEDEAIEVATIASVSASGFDPRVFGCRPFRAPHHTASVHSIVGGGAQARPGEVSLAHNGVLFLDELPEFDPQVLEALREPLENGVIAVSRVAMQAEYPARFQLIAAMNPCPCGYFGDPAARCRCTPPQIGRYRARISGPLLDRIDLRVEVTPIPPNALAASTIAVGRDSTDDSSAVVAARVRDARSRQLIRAGKLNAQLTVRELSDYCQLDAAGERLMWQSQARFGMSARSYHRTLRVARTIADLENSARIQLAHVAEALQLKRALE